MERVNKENHRHITVELTNATPHEYKSKGKGITIEYGFTDTPFGECFVGGSENGICMIQFCDGNREELIGKLKKEWSKSIFHENNLMAQDIVRRALYPIPEDEPIKLWLKGTPFQFKIWKTLLNNIRFGTVTSYGNLAQVAGMPSAVRAVASAVARNPVGYIIPCHRIVRNDGSIGQYHWKPERKAAIIEWEKTAQK